jgi:subtilisin family serine protease
MPGMGFSNCRRAAKAMVLASVGAVVTLIILAPLEILPGRSAILADLVTAPQDLEADQGYLDPAPAGMEVRYAWARDGGRGENVKLIDIENNWNLEHNDLQLAALNLVVYDKGFDQDPADDIDHGTAVLGEIVAANDGIGVTGIASSARLGLINPQVSASTVDMAGAVTKAASLLDAGDVILLEQQIIGPRYDIRTGKGIVPPEFDPAVFQAIKDATSRGIIVVEPASNGTENLDDPIYKGAFDRSTQDSGAIVVGGGMPPVGPSGPDSDRTPTDTTDYGSRVDVQGWGDSITTCGYGDLRHSQGPNNWYTARFGGTSGASAMVAGGAALIESIAKAENRPPLSPVALRQLLVTSGTPQTGDQSRHVGPRPNLRAAIQNLEAGSGGPPPIISAVSYNEAKGRLIVDGTGFIPGDSVVEISGSKISRIKYPAAFIQGDGTIDRLMTKGDITALLPPGVAVEITVLNETLGTRSSPFSFTR